MDLEKYIQEAKEILQSEFGFVPQQSRLVYHTSDSWRELTRRKRSEVNGIYQPRTLTAHVKRSVLRNSLPVVVHEYLGHGSYCEHTKNGRRIVRFEQDLSKLEEELMGRKLPDNLEIQIIPKETESLVESQDPDYDYVLGVKPGNPLVKDYLTKQKRYSQFFQENLPIYEGFAIWLEEWLLKKLKQTKIWKVRQEELEQPLLNFYMACKKFEVENGILSFIHGIGFGEKEH